MTDRSLTKQLDTMPIRGRGVRLNEADYKKWWINRIRANSTIVEGGCWIWNGNLGSKGYGSTAYRGKTCAVHRRAYKLLNNVDLATEQFVCHTCDQRRCWNPAHLFLGTAKDNNNDCASKGRHHNSVKTHCPKGHEFTPENTYTTKQGLRHCRACYRDRGREVWRNRSEESRAKIRAQRRARRSAQRGDSHV